MKINPNTTIVDLAFNLSGSLAGIPVILSQLPVSGRIGFDALPELWEDVDDIGQTWTPNLEDLDLSFDVTSYSTLAIAKAPYTTNVAHLERAVNYGNALLEAIESDEWVSFDAIATDEPITGMELRMFSLDSPVAFNLNEAVPTAATNFVMYNFNAADDTIPFRLRLLPSNLGANLTFEKDAYDYIRVALALYEAVDEETVRLLPRTDRGNTTPWEFTVYHGSAVRLPIMLENGFVDVPVDYAADSITQGDHFDLVTQHVGWSFDKCVFVKLLR